MYDEFVRFYFMRIIIYTLCSIHLKKGWQREREREMGMDTERKICEMYCRELFCACLINDWISTSSKCFVLYKRFKLNVWLLHVTFGYTTISVIVFQHKTNLDWPTLLLTRPLFLSVHLTKHTNYVWAFRAFVCVLGNIRDDAFQLPCSWRMCSWYLRQTSTACKLWDHLRFQLAKSS